VDFQRAMTSAGSRIVMSFRGFADSGRPPFFSCARASIAGVSRGKSAYSTRLMTCASLLERSDRKERRDPFRFSAIGFPHAENMSVFAARHVPNDDNSITKQAITNDSDFAVVPTGVRDLQSDALEHKLRVVKIEATVCERS
jgi:hypothetical protein